MMSTSSSEGYDEIPDHVQKLFQALDSDQSGFLDRTELSMFLMQLGMSDEDQREQTLDLLMARDKEHSGLLDLTSFWACVSDIGGLHQSSNTESSDAQQNSADESAADTSNDRPELSDLNGARRDIVKRGLAAFRAIDVDEDGSLDRAEFTQVVRKLGVAEATIPQVTDALMKQLDENGDGTVSMDEFLAAIRQGSVDALILGTEELQQLQEEAEGKKRRTFTRGYSLDEDDDLDSFVRKPPPSTARSLPPRTHATSSIPDEKYRYLWDLFCVADDDQSGSISEEELFELMSDPTLFKHPSTREVIHNIMQAIDIDNNGVLDFDEFCVAFGQLFTEQQGRNHGILNVQSEALARENRKLRRSVREKNSEISRLATLRRQTTEKMALEEEIHHLTDDVRAKAATISKLETTKYSLESEVQSLTDKVRTLEASLAATKNAKDQFGGAYGDNFSAVEELKKELQEQASVYRQDIQHLEMQAAVAELQLRSAGRSLVMVPELAEEFDTSYLSSLDNERQVRVKALAASDPSAQGSSGNQRDGLVDAASLEEARATITALTADNTKLKEMVEELAGREKLRTSDLDDENQTLRSQLAEAQSTLQMFQDKTKELWEAEQARHREQVQALEDELAAAKEAQNDLEQTQQGGKQEVITFQGASHHAPRRSLEGAEAPVGSRFESGGERPAATRRKSITRSQAVSGEASFVLEGGPEVEKTTPEQLQSAREEDTASANVVKELEEQVRTLQNDNTKLVAERDSHAKSVGTLAAEAAALKDKVAQLERGLGVSQEKVADTSASLEAERKLREAAENALHKAQAALDAEKEERKTLEEQIARAALSDAGTDKTNNAAHDAELALAAREEEVKVLEAKIGALTKRNTSLEETVREMSKGEALADELQANNQLLITTLSKQVTRLTERIKSDPMAEQVSVLQEKLAAKAAEADKRAADVKLLKSRLRELSTAKALKTPTTAVAAPPSQQPQATRSAASTSFGGLDESMSALNRKVGLLENLVSPGSQPRVPFTLGTTTVAHGSSLPPADWRSTRVHQLHGAEVARQVDSNTIVDNPRKYASTAHAHPSTTSRKVRMQNRQKRSSNDSVSSAGRVKRGSQVSLT